MFTSVSSTEPSTSAVPSTSSLGYQPTVSEEAEYREETSVPNLGVSHIKLRNYSSALDRSDTSNRFGLLLGTMFIKDISISLAERARKDFPANVANQVESYLDDLIIDQNKIRRERLKFRDEAIKAANLDRLLKSISFDGKHDKTLKTTNLTVEEDHITLLKEPGSKFIGYTTVNDGTSEALKNGILEFLEKENYSLDHLVAVNCDGTNTNTNTNTGWENGAIRLLEKHLKRPLQWLVCLFHFNELPLEALIRHFFGTTKGPGTWSGNFGIEIKECETYAVNERFEKIQMGDIPLVVADWKKLRGDQKYLYRMVRAINDGVCDAKLAGLKPGPVSTARWLTTACRILRLYISKENPSQALRKLVQFIVKIYAPFWFLVKSQPQAIHGSRNVFQYITWLRDMPNDVQKIVQASIKNNAYFFHPENILLSMVTDPINLNRIRAYNKILEIRQEPQPTIRYFNPALFRINFETLSYITMVEWKHFTTEPPCSQFYTQSQLEDFRNAGKMMEIPGKFILVTIQIK